MISLSLIRPNFLSLFTGRKVFECKMLIINLLWYFVIFSFLGWIINGLKGLLEEKRFSNKGFLTSPFCPSYGVGAVICFLLLRSFYNNLFILFLGSTLVLSALVVIIGYLTQKLLGFKPWDFSDMKLSIGDYITLPSSHFVPA